jgi:hypothetical protein
MGKSCNWGNTLKDRVALRVTGKDTGSMKLTTEVTADYEGPISRGNALFSAFSAGPDVTYVSNKNMGKAIAEGRLAGTHWAGEQEARFLKGKTIIATKAGGINCEPKPAELSCTLNLSTTGLPSAGCALSAGFSCFTVPEEGDKSQKITSEIESIVSGVEITYSGLFNSKAVGGKGVEGFGEAYARNGLRGYGNADGTTGNFSLQGASAKSSVRSVVESALHNVEVIRGNPTSNVTTTATCFGAPVSEASDWKCPDIDEDGIPDNRIRMSCGETLVTVVELSQ